jgi:ribonuclease VapC
LIVVDTSALIAILQGEARAEACSDCLASNERLLMPAPTLTETIILATARELTDGLSRLLDTLPLSIIPLTEERAALAARAYIQWGKGFHRARLNFGDCFAYALAREQGCPLLFVGKDFALTDVEPALR